jgi:hypothetical protein
VRSSAADGGKRGLDYAAGGAGRPSILLSRTAAIGVCAAAFFAVVLVYAGEAFLSVLSVLCADGMLALLWLASAGLLGSVFVRHRMRDTSGALALPSPGTPGEGRVRVVGSALRTEPLVVRSADPTTEPSPGPRPTSPARLSSPKSGVPGEVKILAATSLRIITSIAVGLGIFSLLTLGLGLAGWLNRTTAIAMLFISAAIGLTNIALRLGNLKLEPYIESAEIWLRRPARWAWLWVVAMPFLGMAAVSATLPPPLLWPDPPGDPHPYDVLEYHLQVPREWYELGRIVPLKHNAFSYFPFNVEMQYLLAMNLRGGPWAGMYLAQFMSLGYMALAVAGVYGGVKALSRERRSDEATERRREEMGPHVAGVAAACVPWVMMLGCVAYNECGLLLYGTLAVAWALVGMRNGGSAKAWAMAGAMAGFAVGVKYTAVPLLLVGVPAIAIVCAGWMWFSNRTATDAAPARLFGGIVLYVILGAVVCSPWLIRNAVWTGNPVFPEAMPLLGCGHFTPGQVQRWETAHSAAASQKPLVQRLKATRDQILLDWRYGFMLLPLGVIAAVLSVRRSEGLFLSLMLVSLLLFWLVFTHLQSRFFILAVPVAAILIGLTSMRGVLLPMALLVVLAAGLSWAKLDETLSTRLVPARGRGDDSAVGMTDLSALLPEPLADLVHRHAKLALVGDARAFMYPVPSANLQYRTVFDVAAEPNQSAVEAWLGPDAADLRATHYIVIDVRELHRMAATYRGIPTPRELSGAEPLLIIPPGHPLPEYRER